MGERNAIESDFGHDSSSACRLSRKEFHRFENTLFPINLLKIPLKISFYLSFIFKILKIWLESISSYLMNGNYILFLYDYRDFFLFKIISRVAVKSILIYIIT